MKLQVAWQVTCGALFDHARAQESVDARRECPTTSALTHFRERSRDSLLIADFCSCSSGSMHVLKTMLFAFASVLLCTLVLP